MSRENRSQVSAKTAATVTLTVLGIAFAAWLVWNTIDALLLTSAALLLAVALNPLVTWLERRRVPRWAGIALAMIGVVAVIGVIGWLLIPPIAGQIAELVKEWPDLLAKARRSSVYVFLQRHVGIEAWIAHVERQLPSMLPAALTVTRSILEALGALVTVLFVALFMLASGRPLVRGALAQARPERRARYAELLHRIYRALGGYVAGHLTIVLIQAAATSTFLAIVGVPFFLPIGLLSGLASLIPFAGVAIVGTVGALIAWATHGLGTGIGTAAYYILYQQFENHVLYPMVYRRTVELNPLVIILAVLFVAELGGIPGAILAVPLCAAGQIVVRAVLRARRERLEIPPLPQPEARADH
jgi:predicted PurR-regulated permease PerM